LILGPLLAFDEKQAISKVRFGSPNKNGSIEPTDPHCSARHIAANAKKRRRKKKKKRYREFPPGRNPPRNGTGISIDSWPRLSFGAADRARGVFLHELIENQTEDEVLSEE
jgi:hypothetical protein